MGIIIDPKFGSKTYFIYLFVLFFFIFKFQFIASAGRWEFWKFKFTVLLSSFLLLKVHRDKQSQCSAGAGMIPVTVQGSLENFKSNKKKNTLSAKHLYVLAYHYCVLTFFFFLLLCSLLSGKQKKRGKKMQHILPAGSLSDYLSALGLAWQPA